MSRIYNYYSWDTACYRVSYLRISLGWPELTKSYFFLRTWNRHKIAVLQLHLLWVLAIWPIRFVSESIFSLPIFPNSWYFRDPAAVSSRSFWHVNWTICQRSLWALILRSSSMLVFSMDHLFQGTNNRFICIIGVMASQEIASRRGQSIFGLF